MLEIEGRGTWKIIRGGDWCSVVRNRYKWKQQKYFQSKSTGDYPTITLSAAESEDEDYEDASQVITQLWMYNVYAAVASTHKA